MPKPSPITREHVLDAMTYVGPDPLQWPAASRPKLYLVVDPRNGSLLPPKLVLTTAADIATGERRHRIFSGGADTNRRLEELGFSIVAKSH
ncbi:MAG TPA: hypothetical protein VH206_10275 [Xanthobacteraceae bacterium]|jgi:hypothetical protein|nr:hypothetical protein [Xanthobacteraceae bacterium]